MKYDDNMKYVTLITIMAELRQVVLRGAEKSLAFPICTTTERIFLGWVKEVRTTKT
jgi:hypothetical protein